MSASASPIVATGYKPKGAYEDIDGLKTYVVGDTKSPRTAVLYVYDGFGYQPQTLQGADKIASMTSAVVLMPDFFDGGMPLDYEKIHGTPEGKAYLEKLTGENGPAYKPKVIKQITSFAVAARKAYPSVEKVAALGLGYGGRLLITACNNGAAIDVSAQAFPSHPSAAEASAVRHPHLILASGDESPEGVSAYEHAGMPAGSEVHRFPSMIHGWMGARGNLSDPAVVAEYQKGYQTFAAWLAKVLA